jgi:competence protein ComEC
MAHALYHRAGVLGHTRIPVTPRPLPRFLAALLLALALPAFAAPGKLTVHFFNVGQGDAALITAPSGKTVLVDGGPPEGAKVLERRLPELLGKRPLDLVILSHPHLDHLGGMLEAMRAVGAKRFLDPGFDHPSKSYAELLRWVGANVGQVMNPLPNPEKPEELVSIGLGDGVQLYILWPRVPQDAFLTGTRSDPNSNSVVFKLVYGKTSFLFVGDAEPDTEEYLIQKNIDFASTVLKVGHHGGRHSSTEPFLQRVKPKVAVISCGEGNDYGHPSQAAMDRLARVGAHLFRTDVDGEVLAVSDGQVITLTSEKPQPGFAKGVKATGTTSATVATGPILPGERKLSKSSREDKHRQGQGQGHGAAPAAGASSPVPVDQLAGGRQEDAAAPESGAQAHREKPARESRGGGDAAAATSGTFLASKRSKKFHKADCKGAADIKPENKLFFSTRAEAAEGREPAGDCKP